MSPPVAITGVGAITPLGNNANTLLARWSRGECGLLDGAGLCDQFDPAQHLSKREIRRNDRFAQLALAASEEALTQAGWTGGELPYPATRIACVIGTAVGGLQTIETATEILEADGPTRIPVLTVPMLMGNAAAASISIRHGLQGESFGVLAACASGAHAIGAGLRLLHCGAADAVVVGGCESAGRRLAAASLDATGAISSAGISRPFDRRRDGFVLAEGAGVLVLERLRMAASRGAHVLGEVIGYGASSDAFHLTAPQQDGASAALAITRALADAGLEPEEIDYINAHGTSTVLNDIAETKAIKRAFGPHAFDVPISSTKSAIGHLLGAAGAVEAIATLLALRAGAAPPTLGLEFPDEELDLNYLPGEPVLLASRARRALVGVSNSFGFGGHNAVLVVRAPPTSRAKR
jgi:3-oxoacyl-[acyl-carrier-protein] synthase II